MKTNDLIRHLTKEDASSAEGYDYIITIDKKGWEALDDKDRVRLLRHELRHTFFDIDAEENPYNMTTWLFSVYPMWFLFSEA